MKKFILLCLIISTGLSSAFAAERKAKNSSSDTITASSSAAGKSEFRFGIGAATYSATAVGPRGSLVGLFHFNARNTLQPMFAIHGTANAFQFDTGAIYRHALSLGNSGGFHIGGVFGIGLGGAASNPLNIAMGGVAGVQYQLPGSNDFVLYLDAGPVMLLSDGDANFALTPFSGMFGATLVYLF